MYRVSTYWIDNVEFIRAGVWVYTPLGYTLIRYRSGWCVHTDNNYVKGFRTLEAAARFCVKLTQTP